MPFASAKQRRFMYSQHPEIAQRWTDEAKAEAARRSKESGKKVRPVYIKPWSQPKSERGRAKRGKAKAEVEKSFGPDNVGRQGAHGVNRGWTDKAKRDYQMAGGAIAVVGAANMPGAGRITEHGVNASTSSTGKAVWRGIERGRTHGVIPAGRVAGRQLMKIKPVADLASNIPTRARPFLLLSAGASMMRGEIPKPVEMLNPMGWSG
jgi:hypothetical protein